MSQIFRVNGYWKSDREKFVNLGILIGKEEEITTDHAMYDDVFWSCETEEELRSLMDKDNDQDFVLTKIEKK